MSEGKIEKCAVAKMYVIAKISKLAMSYYCYE